MLSKDLQVCGLGVESDLGMGPVAERFVVRASATAQGCESFPIQVY
jgi:hypothetical protein